MKKLITLIIVIVFLMMSRQIFSKNEEGIIDAGLVIIRLVDENTGLLIKASLTLNDQTLQSSTVYKLDFDEYTITSDEVTLSRKVTSINQLVNIIEIKTNPKPYVKNYEIVNQRYINQVISIEVPEILQKPELPNGCEITSLATLLQANGVMGSKLELESYLNKVEFKIIDGVKYGGDPEVSFVGDPKKNTGWYAFEQPIIEAGNKFLQESASHLTVIKTDQFIELLNRGHALAVWTTLDLSPIRYGCGWYLEEGRKIEAIKNLHCIVIYGYDREHYFVMDPLKGKIKLKRITVEKSYEDMGKRAITISHE